MPKGFPCPGLGAGAETTVESLGAVARLAVNLAELTALAAVWTALTSGLIVGIATKMAVWTAARAMSVAAENISGTIAKTTTQFIDIATKNVRTAAAARLALGAACGLTLGFAAGMAAGLDVGSGSRVCIHTPKLVI